MLRFGGRKHESYGAVSDVIYSSAFVLPFCFLSSLWRGKVSRSTIVPTGGVLTVRYH
jgi:hypothetical protein